MRPEKESKRGIGYLTQGERTIELPESVMMEIILEVEARGSGTKTSVITELLWEAIRTKKRKHLWHTELKSA